MQWFGGEIVRWLGRARVPGLSATALIALSAASPVEAQCTAQWASGFHSPGVSSDVLAMIVFDDGSGAGPDLYCAGSFTVTGTVLANRIGRWNGTQWSTLGSGLDAKVRALSVFDDGLGGGDALYAAGDFQNAGGASASRIAKWNGASWSPLGLGLNGVVSALAVFDDGSGAALYAAGEFSQAGGAPANRIAKWNGMSWSALSVGTLNSAVRALCVWDDDGPGPHSSELYAGGEFTNLFSLDHMAKWNGAVWTDVGSGVNGIVQALAVYDDDGPGPNLPALFAGGSFSDASGSPAERMARFDGLNWTALGAGVDDRVLSLYVFNDGSGTALYAGGQFHNAGSTAASGIARWDGTSWTSVVAGVNGNVYALADYDAGMGAGSELYAGGLFSVAGTTTASRIARWNGTAWSGLTGGNGLGETTSGLGNALATFDDGSGAALYAGGGFGTAGAVVAPGVARWNGTTWSALGSGMNGVVNALATYNDGGGTALYAGGTFTNAGGVTASRIAKWNGTTWSAVGSGFNGTVNALAVYDSGTGPMLYAGGQFTLAGTTSAANIARWSGTTWSAVFLGTNGAVLAFGVYNFGSGAALYVGGSFASAGGALAANVAQWNGSGWLPVGNGTDGAVRAFAGFDHGTGGGSALYMAGAFANAGGVAASRVAKWNNAAWSAVGSGLDGTVQTLLVFDDTTGRGPALFAGGAFTHAGAQVANGIAAWDGASWASPSGGVNGTVAALASSDAGAPGSPRLYAAGSFSTAGSSPSSGIARLSGCSVPGTYFCFGDSLDALVTMPCPCGNYGAPGRGCANSMDSSGAHLGASGSTHIDATTGTDTVHLTCTGTPPMVGCVYLKSALSSSAGMSFGDGVRCFSGALFRLGVKITSNGSATYPETGDTSISDGGSTPPGSGAIGYYQVLYRNALPAFCTSNTYNVSNGVKINW